VLLVANGAFVASEFALVAADRGRIGAAADGGSRRARQVQALFGRLAFHLSGAQLGVTVTSLLIGYLAEPLLGNAFEGPVRALVGDGAAHGVSLALALVLATSVQLVGAELVPKNLAVARPERVALALAAPLRVFDAVLSPLIRAIDAAADRVVMAVGVQPVSELDDVPTLAELAALVRSSGEVGTLDPAETALLSRSIRFGGLTVADAMVPRPDMVALYATDTVADLAAAVHEHGYSRYPLLGEDSDDVVGVVLAKDVFVVAYAHRAATALASISLPAPGVPESLPLENLLATMRAERRQMAVVIDEYGGTAGIVTLEDVLEELVGAIDDEHDEPELTVVPTGGSYVLDGSLHPDEVATACGLRVPEGPYDTLAGFALVRFDRVPAEGDGFDYDGWRLEVVEMDRRRIARLDVRPPEAS
jgi:CBS domain containing-hemolysin-like protein